MFYQNEIDWMMHSGVRQDDLLSFREQTYHKRLKTNIINKLYVYHYVSLYIVNQFIKTYSYIRDIRNLAYILLLVVIVTQTLNKENHKKRNAKPYNKEN